VIDTPTSPAVGTATVANQAIPEPPKRDLIDLQRRLRSSNALTPTVVSTPRSNVAGSESSFWIANQQSKSYFTSKARLALVADHVYWYVEDGVDVPPADLQSAATFFDTQTYPTEHRLFGSEWPANAAGDLHLTILIGHIPGVGGYYSTADEYPTVVNPFSNQRKMIYINVDAVRPGGGGFNGTVAHEFQHMIQFNVHRDQNSWINEGSAELAAQAVTGVASGGVPSFERQPQTQLNGWASEPATSIPHYGAAYLFMRYIAEQFGGFATVGKIVADPGRDVDAFTTVFASLQPPRTFDQVFADWVAANFLDDTSLSDGRFGYKGIKVRVATQPGPRPGQPIHGIASQLGVTYYQIAADTPAHLKFTGTGIVKLIGADPHQSSFEWWSNHGDSIDSRLTRPVDLTTAKSAMLHFWTWYDIEEGFDYGYVEASTDGGHTWSTLPATDTTTANPNGQNYGNGFTGESGGKTPSWIHESVDLSKYEGQRILLRFEYVTDDSYNADGFAIDGVEIPEIGLKDPTTSDDGWTADGFTRIDNRLPESYLVESLDPSDPTPAKTISVGADGRASTTVPAGKAVVVAVGGLAAQTTHQAAYTLELVPD
jgi:hypothetical protein